MNALPLVKCGQLALVAAAIALPSVSALATENSRQRQQARETRQETRETARDTKAECRASDQKANAECRWDKRGDKAEGRQKARDIKY